MDGFLPLIEAFLAFALTILALTTAVSAIVGTCQRALRWRPRVLRDMVDYFYRNEVQEQVERLWEEHRPAVEQAKDAGDAASAKRKLPVVLDSFVNQPGDDTYRRRFVAQMTLLPTVLLGPKGKPDPAAREKEIQKTDRSRSEAAGTPGGKLVRLRRQLQLDQILSWWAGWRSLRHGLDRLTDEDFMARLRSSLPGQAIAELQGSRANQTLTNLKERFDAHGVASLDLFQKRSRTWCVVIGFVLAFGVNIDALFLLNSYLTNEDLRLKVIADSDRIVGEAEQNVETLAAEKASVSQNVEDLTAQFTEAVAAAKELSENSVATLGSLPIADFEATVSKMKQGLASFQVALDTTVEAAREAEKASGEIRGVIQSLTQNFPVGWMHYPNCSRNSMDLRCSNARRSRGEQDVGAKGFWGRLAASASDDTSAFVKWLTGVLITGLMVGLGTPFWVEVVNGALRTRKWLRGGGGQASVPERRML